MRLGRLLKSWWRRLAGRPDGEISIVFSPKYRLELSGLAQDPRRNEKVLSYIAGRGLVGRGEVHPAPLVAFRDLCRVHDVEYLESLSDAETLTRVVGIRLGEADRDRVVEVQRRMAGGTRRAQELARGHGGIAFNLGGGTHHAFRDHGARLCLINDVAVAVAAARADGLDGAILVVDLDLHDGDGTRNIFADDETVHTFSIHNASSGTDPDAVASTSIELGSGVGDDRFLDALQHHLPKVVEEVRPDLTFYLAGTDVAEDDTLGDWKMSDRGIFARDVFVTRLLRGAAGGGGEQVPLVVVLAGGYGRESWRHSARYLSWLLTGEEIDPPSTEAALLDHYRRLARRFTQEELTGEEGDGNWDLTEEDVLGALGGAPRRRRFLGFYSPHGLELALERTGFLGLLRRRGFPEPTLDIDLDNPAGETLRLFASPQRRHLLMELRVRRDAHVLPDFEMLRVEWLLLQDPRQEFTGERPPLPGQRHPGLGLLEDTVALLILVCERLDLDGIFFVPSHYHLAAQSRGLLAFLEPAHEALFRELERVLEPLPLLEATRAVEAGHLVREDEGEPFEFPQMPMVLPVSDRLKRRIESDEYREAVERAAAEQARLRLRV